MKTFMVWLLLMTVYLSGGIALFVWKGHSIMVLLLLSLMCAVIVGKSIREMNKDK